VTLRTRRISLMATAHCPPVGCTFFPRQPDYIDSGTQYREELPPPPIPGSGAGNSGSVPQPVIAAWKSETACRDLGELSVCHGWIETTELDTNET
jgi:hypothetical protein